MFHGTFSTSSDPAAYGRPLITSSRRGVSSAIRASAARDRVELPEVTGTTDPAEDEWAGPGSVRFRRLVLIVNAGGDHQHVVVRELWRSLADELP